MAGLLAVALAVPVAVVFSDRLPSRSTETAVQATTPSLSTAPTAPTRPRSPARARVVGGAGRPLPGVVFRTAEPEPEPEDGPGSKGLAQSRRQAEKAAAAAAAAAASAASAPFSFKIGTFNVLGSQHTDADGPRKGYPPASVRTPAAANLVLKHGVDIVGAQELQADQLRGLQARTGMAAYPGFSWGEAETDNSILYDAGLFELVSGSQFTAPFMGRPRPQPIVRLRHLATGREFYVVNTHPSAGEGQYLAERRQGQATLVGVVNDLKASGLPVLVTGDMNDREEFYCNVVPQAGLSAPNGGSYGDGCRPPASPIPVDWVVGSGATWSDYWRDTTPVTQKTSDHFFISATAHVG